ncbi:MAG: glutamate--cysteine ligase, partial [Porticoccaceae bacterium]
APKNSALLTGILRGLEKESLRVTPDGVLATSGHPRELGSTLTHPNITTDYSEALVEFITPPTTSVKGMLDTLEDIHRFTYQHMGKDLLWVNSMPCVLGRDDDIPVARYGHSNIGRMKTVYRVGLGHRYGRLMQTIAGIHYNWSLPDDFWALLHRHSGSTDSLKDFKTTRYFGLIRNFRRHFWLLLYLFGAAPAVCRTFVANREHSLVPFGADDHSLHMPFATSLRMGNLGYQSNAQESLVICYNSLGNYIENLRRALTTPYPPYERIGLKDAGGHYRQLSTHLLQIENEFYGSIRPKRSTASGEAPLPALWQRGVEYVEVRCLDLNPYLSIGIDAQQVHFLDVFLLHCVLADSPETDDEEYRKILENQRRVVYRGRDPGVVLLAAGGGKTLRAWGEELCTAMQPVAALLDQAFTGEAHGRALTEIGARLHAPEQTPAAQLLAEMARTGQTYFETAQGHALQHREYFLGLGTDPLIEAQYAELAARSLADQRAIEAGDTINFDDFLARYYAQYQFPLDT